MNLVPLIFLSLSALFADISPANNPDKNLVAYYSFDNCDARDDTGFGSDGKMFGSIECWCGVKDDGLLFDGINDYIRFGGRVNQVFNTTDFTISFYFKTAHRSVFRQSLLSKRTQCDEIQMLDLLLDGNLKILETEVHESPEIDYPGLSPALDSTRWQHFALVRKGTMAYTYINGAMRQKSRRCSGVDISNDAPLSFSDSPCLDAGVRRFKGVLDELRIYDRALEEAEIFALYRQNPVETAEQDCFSYLPKNNRKAFPQPAETDYLCQLY